jgi:hypothetical protein
MSLHRFPFLNVLALFFAEGILLWGVSLLEENLLEFVSAIWLGAFGSVIGWWVIWPALAAERGWRPWLNWLALMGASYWLPVALDRLVRPAENGFIPLSGILYLVLGLAVALNGLPALVYLLIARIGFGWRLESPGSSQPFGLRGMFLMTVLVAGHLAAFLLLLRESTERPPKLNDFAGLGALALFLLPVIAVVLGSSGLILARAPFTSAITASVGTLLLLGFALVTHGPPVQAALMIVSLLVASALQALALRWLGYRISNRRDRLKSDKLWKSPDFRTASPLR